MQREMPFRLALRVEGKFWNAYLAKYDTMDDATLLGSILMTLVDNDAKRRRVFIDLMSEALADAIEQIVGVKPDMVERPAPESERAGNA